jgi:microcystin-dependent protein
MPLHIQKRQQMQLVRIENGRYAIENLTDVNIVGEIRAYAGSSAPAGWLLCDGSAVSRETYSNLFSVIGVSFGDGDESTTFNLPDLRGRSLIGSGQGKKDGAEDPVVGVTGPPAGASMTNRNRGLYGGEEKHTLLTTEMPAHTHGCASPWQTLFESGGTDRSPGSYSDAQTTSTGGNGNHNTMPPWCAVNFIIKI